MPGLFMKTKPCPPIDVLRSVLCYNDRTGVFTWRKTNKAAGYINVSGYRVISIRRKMFYAHRLAWVFLNGRVKTGMEIDHINGVKGDNRACNLRLATRSQQGANKGAPRNNTSGIKNVNWHKASQKWRATICMNGKRIHIGTFTDKSRAVDAVNGAGRFLYGEFWEPARDGATMCRMV